MSDKEFNLLDEQWIRVIDKDCHIAEVSLVEVFRDAHLYKDLCGELPTQDFAMMRLLLAVLHTVFARYDMDGNVSPLNDTEDALDRWEALWNNKKFPIAVIEKYLESQRENFYLFHPERPFYQCEHAKVGTKYSAAKLNGNLSESSNKIRLFQTVSGKIKEEMSFSEAARWILYVNAYDDTSAKPSSESKKESDKLPSPGVGWLGKLGLVAVSGKNLFDTLVLNLILFNENSELFGEERPIWERDKIPEGERIQIQVPDNLAELYTLQSRRLYLERDGQKVIGYSLLGGDFFDKENAFVEPMTIWRNTNSKATEVYTPHRHDPTKQFWRNFSAFIQRTDKQHCPGIISWIMKLENEGLIENYFLNMKIASVQYGDKDFFVTDVFSDSMQIHASLLAEMNREWRRIAIDSVEFCDTISNLVWIFAKDVNLAEGGDFVPKENKCSAKVFADKSKAEFYSRVDVPFRKWLCSLDPDADNADEKEKEWREECVEIARNLGEDIVKQAGSAAIFGRAKGAKKDEKNQKAVYSVAEAMNIFQNRLKAEKDL